MPRAARRAGALEVRLAEVQGNQGGATRSASATAGRQYARFVAALAVLTVLAGCVAASNEGSSRADEDASSTPEGGAPSVGVDTEQLMLAATRAAEACGDGGVESVRVATEGLTDGVDFVCRDDPEASVQELLQRIAAETCEGDVVSTSVGRDSSGTLTTLGFKCGREAP